jgi:hypothetical protein
MFPFEIFEKCDDSTLALIRKESVHDVNAALNNEIKTYCQEIK